MTCNQKVIPKLDKVTTRDNPLRAKGQHHQSALSRLPEPDQTEKHWRSMSKEPRLASAEQAGQMAIPSASEVSRANRVSRYEAVRALHQQALSERAIARRLNLSRHTVHWFLTAESFPERRKLSY